MKTLEEMKLDIDLLGLRIKEDLNLCDQIIRDNYSIAYLKKEIKEK